MQKSILIQNADVAAKPSHYKHLKDDELLVYSTFFTIQGEGPYAGYPSFFIRLAGCNFGAKDIACQGCDTKFFFGKGKVTHIGDLVAIAYDAVGDNGLVVVTGGEPCLQKNLVDFCALAADQELYVQIETNGTQKTVTEQLLDQDMTIVVCSPKASGKGYAKTMPPWYSKLDYLKFVVTSDAADPHHTIPEWAHAWVAGEDIVGDYSKRLYVSPLTVYKRPVNEGEIVSAWDTTLVDHEATMLNYKHAAALALAHKNIIVSTQQHTFLSLE